MPQEALFDIPFPSLVNPHWASARADHLTWIRSRDLVSCEARVEEYLSWDLPQATARIYPYADQADLKMLMDFFSIFFLFDDEFDMLRDGRRARLAAVTQEMVTIPFRPAGASPDIVSPITVAWVEVWTGLCREMSETWKNRFASNWARFLTAALEESHLTARTSVMGLASYVDLRRQSVGIYHSLDAAERSRRFEVPPHALAHQRMRDLRAAATDTIGFMNDVQSLERDERRGNPYNLILMLGRELNCPRTEAIELARQMTRERLSVVIELQADIPGMCADLGLSDDECIAVDQGVEGVRNWIRGYYDWACQSGRYAASSQLETTADQLQNKDDLLAPL
jgi:Terpene synthase family 2, C-terminal metal binding